MDARIGLKPPPASDVPEDAPESAAAGLICDIGAVPVAQRSVLVPEAVA
jgi:hypothetical protein